MHGGSAKFCDLYELQEDIGVGSYSICKRCVHRVSAVDYAVKVTKKKLTWGSNITADSRLLFCLQCYFYTL